MAEQKKRFFVLVDQYARSHLRCFVAELDYSPEELVYTLCFRRTDGTRDSPHRYDCKYLWASAEEVRTMVEVGTLAADFEKHLNEELSSLRP